MVDVSNAELPIIWKKAEIVATVAAGIIIPLVIAYVGHIFTEAAKYREVSVKYIEIAISVLASDTENSKLTVWATKILNTYSPEPLPLDEDLINYNNFATALRSESIFATLLQGLINERAKRDAEKSDLPPSPT